MATVYRYCCPPNYPLVSAATLFFAMNADDAANPLDMGREIAKDCGFKYAGSSDQLDVIAEHAKLVTGERWYKQCLIIQSISG